MEGGGRGRGGGVEGGEGKVWGRCVRYKVCCCLFHKKKFNILCMLVFFWLVYTVDQLGLGFRI